MANLNVLKRPKVRENLNRNAFDRSFIRNYHCSHGMIIPIMMEPCIAGTKGVINRQCFTRSFDIVSPAFPNVVQCFDFFKVPIRYLWSNWENWKTNINDINSSALAMNLENGSINGLGNIPRMDFGSGLINTINSAFLSMGLTSAQITRFVNDYFRLAEGLGYGEGIGNASANVKNLLPIAAYQKVYYDHYRNTSYENNNPYAYNLDWLTTLTNVRDGLLSVPFDTKDATVFKELFTLRYVNYRNDYFHNIYPSLMFSSTQNTGVPDWLAPSIPGIGSSTAFFKPQYNATADNTILVKNNSASGTSAFSVNAIRAAFALDKLLRASSYAPKHVRDQYKARFGVDLGDKVSFESERIGSFTDEVVFGEVTNQADTLTANSGSPLGAIGGKGLGASKSEKDLHFYCEEDSIILGVTYFLVRAVYDSYEDEWNNKLTREEFFQPEYQNLGLRMLRAFGVDHGYTVPYQRYKLGVDENLGMFKSTYALASVNGTSGAQLSFPSNPLRSFTVHSNSSAFSVGGGVNYMYFKALPEHLDSIFRTSFDVQTGNPNTDQFYFNIMVKFAVTQNMSVHGMPSF